MSEKYKIKEILGMSFIQDADGSFINAPELGKLIAELTSLHNSMTAQQLTQMGIQDQKCEDLIDEMMLQAKVHFPIQENQYPFLEYRPGPPYLTRQPRHKRFSGVYFMVSTHDGIKVGQSHDIYKRSRQLFSNYEREIFQVVGFIEADNFLLLEKLLHRKFRSFNIVNEWFEPEPIWMWLKSIGGQK